MYILLFWNIYCDQKSRNKPLFFSLVFARIGGKRTRAKDQKQTIYFKRPQWLYPVKLALRGSAWIMELGLAWATTLLGLSAWLSWLGRLPMYYWQLGVWIQGTGFEPWSGKPPQYKTCSSPLISFWKQRFNYLMIIFVPRLNEVEEGGYWITLCLSFNPYGLKYRQS